MESHSSPPGAPDPWEEIRVLRQDNARLEQVLQEFREEQLRLTRLRTEASEALHKWAQIFENAEWGVAVGNIENHTLDIINPAYAHMHGYSIKELLGKPLSDMLAPESWEDASERIRSILEMGRHSFETRHMRNDGSTFPVNIHVTVVKDSANNPQYLVAHVQDITEQKHAEALIINHREEYRTLFNQTPAMIWYKDRENRILRVNQSAAESMGLSIEELEGKSTYKLYPEEAAAYHKDDLEVIHSGLPKLGIVEQLQTAGGEKRWVQTDKVPYRDERGEIIGVIVFALDITERKRTEEALHQSYEQLRQAQKMEAVGRLAGGVSHDFNNLFTAINGYSTLLLSAVGEDSPLRSHLLEIRKAGERGAGLTHQLLPFSRKQVVSPQVMDLNAIVREIEKMLRRLIGENINLNSELDPNLKKVKVDPGQMEQVILNLALNARDAMPEGGMLCLTTSNTELWGQEKNAYMTIEKGKYVLLSVKDTGCGMGKEIKAHLFEPFFSTKEKGKGTGLGLSLVYGIVKRFNGGIMVTSEPRMGTTFQVYLPIAEDEETIAHVEEADTGPNQE